MSGRISISSHYPDDNEGNIWLRVDDSKWVFINGECPAYVPGDIVDFGGDLPGGLEGTMTDHRVDVTPEEIVVTLRIRRAA